MPVGFETRMIDVPDGSDAGTRSEEHTSELQSHSDLVCRLLLEKKKNDNNSSEIDRLCLITFSELHLSLPLFFFNDTATTEIYTLSLHDALPICPLSYRPYWHEG